MEREEKISVHVIHAEDTEDVNGQDDAEFNLRFDVRPFRHTFFRYSMYGKSEVVKASSTVFASHHQSESEWLHIDKLSVALVGSRISPNLTFFAPTVKEINFIGHISYPTTAFKMMEQMQCLTNVTFNLGLAGLINEYHEGLENLHELTPEIPSVTSLEVVLDRDLFRSATDNVKSLLIKVITSVLKHSKDSFSNLEHLSIKVPNEPGLLDRVIDLTTSSASLSSSHSVRVVGTHEFSIEVSRRLPTFRASPQPLNPVPDDGGFISIQQIINACCN